MCDGSSKQSPDPKNSTTPQPRPLVLKFLDLSLLFEIGTFVLSRKIKRGSDVELKSIKLYKLFVTGFNHEQPGQEGGHGGGDRQLDVGGHWEHTEPDSVLLGLLVLCPPDWRVPLLLVWHCQVRHVCWTGIPHFIVPVQWIHHEQNASATER